MVLAIQHVEFRSEDMNAFALVLGEPIRETEIEDGVVVGRGEMMRFHL